MRIILVLLSMIFMSGCATILNDEKQLVNVSSSNNTDFKGTIDGVAFTGPGIISIKRSKQDRIIMIETPACQKQLLVSSSVDMKFFINILSGGTFGSSTDYATDEMWKYQDNIIITCK